MAINVFQESQDSNSNPVRTEEAKLKAKYPSLGQKPGGSDFLMKRLQKGVCLKILKYFFTSIIQLN